MEISMREIEEKIDELAYLVSLIPPLNIFSLLWFGAKYLKGIIQRHYRAKRALFIWGSLGIGKSWAI